MSHHDPKHDPTRPPRRRSGRADPKETDMTRTVLVLLVMLLTAAAFAQNPHFVGATTAVINDDGSLTVSWKEAGLGNNQNIDYLLTTDAVATYACQNHGGNFPKDPKKFDQASALEGRGTFSSGQNGQITESLTVGPPPPPSPSNCKGNQVEVLLAVSYANIVLTDTTNGVATTAPDVSRTFFTLP
jgi:hypothetical protein